MTDKIKGSISFYKLCNKLKDTIRKGPSVWKAKRSRIESVAEHIYGVQMLAISIYYQFNYKLDLKKVIFMLAIHELEEIEIGDLAFYETTEQDKLIKGKAATDMILKDFMGKEEISALLDEYNERKTEEARFAYHCDKLECEIQIKLYEQEGCFDLSDISSNPAMSDSKVKELFNTENSLSKVWFEFDRNKFEDDPVFIDIINYLKDNDI